MGIIVTIFKGGEKNDLNNYRGITLLSIVGKLLVGMLNERLSSLKNTVFYKKIRQDFGKATERLIISSHGTLSLTIQSKLKRNHCLYVS